VDRRQLDDVAAQLDRLTGDPGGGPLVEWQDLWRSVTDDPGESPTSVAACAQGVERALGRPGHRFVAYGTLRPGEVNHHLLAGLGSWQSARVRGRLGDWNGYPVLRPARADGPALAVMLLTSSRLPDVLPGLDRFEGPAYRRSWVVAEPDPPTIAGEAVIARCYVEAADPPG
jgi:gamma-glutamylcyclotransferase (GGCT)/AIG2-like uncharacterized protein YtfP